MTDKGNICDKGEWDDNLSKFIPCKNKSQYCKEHYNKEYFGRRDAEEKRDIWMNIAWFFIFAFLGSLLVLLNWGKTIDEDGFCLEKIKEQFPENNFISAVYNPVDGVGDEAVKDVCTIKIRDESVLTKDGLKFITNNEEKIIKFQLINQADIDYLDSDNIPTTLLGFGLFFWVISCGIILYNIIFGRIR